VIVALHRRLRTGSCAPPGRQIAPGDQLYVWGIDTLIYYLTGLGSPTRFILNYPLKSTWGPPAWKEELIGALKSSPPAFIVVARHDRQRTITLVPLDSEQYLKASFRELDEFIAGSYRPVETLPDFVVYRRAAVP
jgi:hypothetical protein